MYSKLFEDHFENPRNVGVLDESLPSVGTGVAGSPTCGDVTKLQIEVGTDGRIVDAKFKTFGCGAAIASSSLATEWLKGKHIDEVGELKNANIAAELGLPPPKVHCSVLAEDAVKAALEDWKKKNQNDSAK